MDFINQTRDLKSRIEILKNEKMKYDEMDNEFDQAIDDLEEQREQLLFLIAEDAGMEKLQMTRKAIGYFMSMANKNQKDAYERQKERYTNCKSMKYFTQSDRDYIAHFQMMNESYKKAWFMLYDWRTELCEIIETLDPSDPDMGTDEEM